PSLPVVLAVLMLWGPAFASLSQSKPQAAAWPSPFQVHPRANSAGENWEYSIPSEVQHGSSSARFNISTPDTALSQHDLRMLDAPQVANITEAVFDWWYFDAVSETNPKESIVVILFSSSANAFPWLDKDLDSVLVAYLWASFGNGTVFAHYVPATLATVTGGDDTVHSSSGDWSSTGFSWTSRSRDLSQYEVRLESREMHVKGRVALSSPPAPHLPCGINSPVTTLEIFPHIGWAGIIPDATSTVEITVQGSPLTFQGRGYHDKNWSDRPFIESVQSWYWGHGRVGPYSIVWFDGIDTTNTPRTSSYVARDNVVLLGSCSTASLTVRPVGASNTTGGRYPPQAGDIPIGFALEFDLGNEGILKVHASAEATLVNDGRYYFRWSGPLTGELLPASDQKENLTGVAVFEQFALVE
ncbi:Hydroxyneurosporene synthase, partial [Penicillium chermesinum]